MRYRTEPTTELCATSPKASKRERDETMPKEISDADASCPAFCCRTRAIAARWSRRREAHRRRQGAGGELAGLGHEGGRSGSRDTDRLGGRKLQSIDRSRRDHRG